MAHGKPGIPFISVSGKAGNVVIARVGDGLVVRERVTPANPRTPAQRTARGGLAAAAQAWGELTDAQFEAWQDYARPLGRPAYNVFVSLAAKFLRVHPGSTPPSEPPSAPFFGDALRVAATPGAGGGAVTFSASRPNADGVVTELLIQPLLAPRRKPGLRDWRSAGFVAFASASLSVAVPVEPGAYACAYRFVESATGQETAMAVLGSVVVTALVA